MAIAKVEDTFINERGNQIRMVVTAGPVSAKIWMQGPASQMTNDVTRMEAERLRDLLNAALGS